MHGPGYSGGNPRSASYTLPKGQKFANAFHTFSVQWSADAVAFFVDGALYETVKPAAIPAGTKWVFDAPFFMLINLAVGGSWPGNPDATTQFPQEMLVDYVRVYRAAPTASTGPAAVVDAASHGKALAPGSIASAFGTFVAGDATSVMTNGVASTLFYVSTGQINFRIPRDALVGNPMQVEVMTDGAVGSSAAVNLATAAPSSFAVTCAGANCSLWGNGFGASPSGCKLTVGGVDAQVTYCGPAPGIPIGQLNFVYPAGVMAATGLLTVSGVTAEVRL